jgi:hypothetical protein
MRMHKTSKIKQEDVWLASKLDRSHTLDRDVGGTPVLRCCRLFPDLPPAAAGLEFRRGGWPRGR